MNVAKQDQTEAACRDVAEYCRMMCDALLAQGFTHRDAIRIVVAMVGRLKT